jgi:hypothetical protein
VRTAVAVVGAVAVFAAGIGVGAGVSAGPGADGPAEAAGPVGPAGPDGTVELPDALDLAGALTSFDACDDYLAHVRERALDEVTPYGLGGGAWRGLDAPASEEAEMAVGTDDAGAADRAASFADAVRRHHARRGVRHQRAGAGRRRTRPRQDRR